MHLVHQLGIKSHDDLSLDVGTAKACMKEVRELVIFFLALFLNLGKNQQALIVEVLLFGCFFSFFLGLFFFEKFIK
ncbi:MAG TPA: hypothetical protein DCY86_11875 [Bdellovibrionales bacterium]|nr:hypothetical protein [Bdellovibrionales bacterium]